MHFLSEVGRLLDEVDGVAIEHQLHPQPAVPLHVDTCVQVTVALIVDGDEVTEHSCRVATGEDNGGVPDRS
ncbi:hypothetical protein D3C79_986460 [compost metagenome]